MVLPAPQHHSSHGGHRASDQGSPACKAALSLSQGTRRQVECGGLLVSEICSVPCEPPLALNNTALIWHAVCQYLGSIFTSSVLGGTLDGTLDGKITASTKILEVLPKYWHDEV